MKKVDNTRDKQVFQLLRSKYPQKLKQVSIKAQVLKQWISQIHLVQFRKLFDDYSEQKHPQRLIPNQKVLDQNGKNQTDSKKNEVNLDIRILQSVKIVVQAYQKNLQICEKYDYQHVQQMVAKTKQTMKQLFNQAKKQLNYERNLKDNVKREEKQAKRQDDSKEQQSNKNTKNQAANQTSKVSSEQQLIAKKPTAIQKKPKSNNLFVSKQIPIPQENIFKGQNKFGRPSSRLANQKVQNFVQQKPKSSTKSNRSKKSVSSQGQKSIPKFQQEQKGGTVSNLEHQEIRQKNQTKKQRYIQYQQQQVQVVQVQLNKGQYLQGKQWEPQKSLQQLVQVVQITEKLEQTKKLSLEFTQNSKLQLPSFKLSSQRPTKRKSSVQSVLTNPFIRKAFTHICKQSYVGGGKTFDQIAQSADIMTLNKWMVFCKQFDFLTKLKKKVLVDIYQQSTQNKAQMSQRQFLDALIIVQNKLKVDQGDFIRNNMCLDSDFAFRQKVASFKVNYAGPRVNFFEEATMRPLDRYYEQLRQQKHQIERKKRKQYILHQGKFIQQIQSQLQQRKQQRQLKKMINLSVIQRGTNNSQILRHGSMDRKLQQNTVVKSPYLRFVQSKSSANKINLFMNNQNKMGLQRMYASRRVDPLTYSDIFNKKNQTLARAFTTQNEVPLKYVHQVGLIKGENQGGTTKTRNKQQDSTLIGKQSKLPISNQHKVSSTRQQKTVQLKPLRQWSQAVKDWAQDIERSQSQESDDILRQHLMKQKIKQVHMYSKIEPTRVVQPNQKEQKHLGHTDFHNQQCEQEIQTQLQWEKQAQIQATVIKERFK